MEIKFASNIKVVILFGFYEKSSFFRQINSKSHSIKSKMIFFNNFPWLALKIEYSQNSPPKKSPSTSKSPHKTIRWIQNKRLLHDASVAWNTIYTKSPTHAITMHRLTSKQKQYQHINNRTLYTDRFTTLCYVVLLPSKVRVSVSG